VEVVVEAVEVEALCQNGLTPDRKSHFQHFQTTINAFIANNHPNITNNNNRTASNNTIISNNTSNNPNNINSTIINTVNNPISNKANNNTNIKMISDNTNKTNNQTTETTIPVEPIDSNTILKTNMENRYTFCIHISAKQAKASDIMSREAETEHILQSFIKAEAFTALATTTTTSSYQRPVTQSLYQPNCTELISNSKRFLNELQLSTKGNITGNIWISSDIPYSSLKRIFEFKKHLSTKYSIHMMANNLNTRTPTEIGYFLHRIVRHDTVENTTHTKSFLPKTTKPFQQKQTSLWAGPTPELRKTVSVMVISTRSEDATEMTKIFKQTIRNPSKMTFISKSFLSTLDSISRLQFVESQIAYTRQTRSILLRHIKNLNVPSIHVSTDNQPIMVYDCIKDIKDYLQIFNEH
jgi:hypothetical protein